MILFWKLDLKIKISISQDFKTTFKYNLTCIFLSVRAQLKKPLCPRTPCTTISCRISGCAHLWAAFWAWIFCFFFSLTLNLSAREQEEEKKINRKPCYFVVLYVPICFSPTIFFISVSNKTWSNKPTNNNIERLYLDIIFNIFIQNFFIL